MGYGAPMGYGGKGGHGMGGPGGHDGGNNPNGGAGQRGPHPNFKSKLCKRFQESGHCNFGERCGFAHGDHDLRQSGTYGQVFLNPGMSAPEGAAAPMDSMGGKGGYGGDMGGKGGYGGGYGGPPDRGQNDGLLKTKLCVTHQRTGVCSFGDRCRFAHGEEELRASDGPGQSNFQQQGYPQEQNSYTGSGPATAPMTQNMAPTVMAAPNQEPAPAAVIIPAAEPAPPRPVMPPVGPSDCTPLDFGGTKRAAGEDEGDELETKRQCVQ